MGRQTSKDRRTFMTQCLAGASLVAASPSPRLSAAARRQRRRNIVLFVADDQGQDAGCYGNPVVRTPHLDWLASLGTLFRLSFATTASCSASRSVLLSGLHNHRTGQYGHQHDYHHFHSFENLRGLPVLLGEAGYRTASIGKYHVAPEPVYHFHHYLPGEERNPVQMAEVCREFIRDPNNRPFFLYFCTADPHRGGGDASELPHRPNRFGNRPGGYPGVETVEYDGKDVLVPPFLPDTPTCRAELAQYYQSVSRLDQGLGRLLEILQEGKVFDETLFIYLSDHGIAFPGAKTTTYEPGLRSPCVVCSPDQQRRGVQSQALISWADITPTLLDFAGIDPPRYPTHVALERLQEQLPAEHGLHGRSFLSILDEEQPAGWDEVYASHTFHEIQMYYPMRVVRDRRYKLIWNIAHPLPYPFASDLWASPTWQEIYRQGPQAHYGRRTVEAYIHRPRFELYDLERDPDEIENLASNPHHADLLEKYQAKLQAFQKRTSDPWLLKWEYE